MEWQDIMMRWLRGAQAHLTFEDLVNTIFSKLDQQMFKRLRNCREV